MPLLQQLLMRLAPVVCVRVCLLVVCVRVCCSQFSSTQFHPPTHTCTPSSVLSHPLPQLLHNDFFFANQFPCLREMTVALLCVGTQLFLFPLRPSMQLQATQVPLDRALHPHYYSTVITHGVHKQRA